MKIWKITGIALVVVLAVSVVTGTLAFAQSANPGAGDATEQGAPGGMRNRGPNFGGSRDGQMGRGGEMDETTLEFVADALGLTVEELQAELDAGKRVFEIAEELGIEEADLQEAFKAARIAHIEQAVVDGDLTQEQADAILEQMEQAEQIAEAMEAMRNAEIEEALANGVITEEQAELLRGLGGKGGAGFGGQRGGRMGSGNQMFHGERAPGFAPNQN